MKWKIHQDQTTDLGSEAWNRYGWPRTIYLAESRLAPPKRLEVDCSKPTREPDPPAGRVTHGLGLGQDFFLDPTHRVTHLRFEDPTHGWVIKV
jgi:hypothetical protein